MAITTYDVGDGIRVTATFTDLTGTLADPTGVAFKLLDPSGSVTLPAVVRVSTGVYHADIVATNLPGTWAYRWEGTGAVQAAEEGRFMIRTSYF